MARPGCIPTTGSKMMYEEYNPEAAVETRTFFNIVDQYAQLDSSCSNPPFRYSTPGAMATEAYRKNISGFFRTIPSPYTHRNYQFASIIFNVMKHNVEQFLRRPSRKRKHSRQQRRRQIEPSAPNIILQAVMVSAAAADKLKTTDGSRNECLPQINFSSQKEKRLSFTLVFETLKCMFINIFVHSVSFSHLNFIVIIFRNRFKPE